MARRPITITASGRDGGPGWLLCWGEPDDGSDTPAHTHWYQSCDDAMAVRLLMQAGATFVDAHTDVLRLRLPTH